MKLTLVRSLTATAVLASALAVAQSAPPATSAAALPAAPGSASTNTPATIPAGGGAKIGTINIEAAIFASNEGQRDGNDVAKKLEPKQNELKGMNDEVEGLKKQLTTQASTLNDDAKADLTRKIEQKQKQLERSNQELQEEARNQENEIGQRILRKMGPLIVKYASDNGFGLIIDTSPNNQWPNGPVLWQNAALDITKPVVDAYNVQSGVPAPAQPKTGTPSGSTRPGIGGSTGATRPSTTTPTTKPSTTTPPK